MSIPRLRQRIHLQDSFLADCVFSHYRFPACLSFVKRRYMSPGINMTPARTNTRPNIFVMEESIIQKDGAIINSGNPTAKHTKIKASKNSSSLMVDLSFLKKFLIVKTPYLMFFELSCHHRLQSNHYRELHDICGASLCIVPFHWYIDKLLRQLRLLSFRS